MEEALLVLLLFTSSFFFPDANHTEYNDTKKSQ
jgi:hypothetical protein